MALTVDTWSDSKKYGFLKVTSHMILDFERKIWLIAHQCFLMYG